MANPVSCNQLTRRCLNNHIVRMVRVNRNVYTNRFKLSMRCNCWAFASNSMSVDSAATPCPNIVPAVTMPLIAIAIRIGDHIVTSDPPRVVDVVSKIALLPSATKDTRNESNHNSQNLNSNAIELNCYWTLVFPIDLRVRNGVYRVRKRKENK